LTTVKGAASAAPDPLTNWWDALERGGYEPRGQAHDFRSKCPLHDGGNPTALHIFVGADGRAVPHCFVCNGHPKDIAAAVGLDPRDSFPQGHHRARRRRLPDAHRVDFTGNARTVANILCALDQLGREWYIELRADCPHCGGPAAVVFAASWGIEYLACPGDADAEALGYTACTLDQFVQALAARVEDRKRAA